MIYIIIPIHNRKGMLKTCLECLQKQDMQDFSIIVVDDGSTDGTDQMVQREFPNVILLVGDGNLWWAGSINMGIRHALNICHPEDYILTLNDDLIVLPDYLGKILNAAKLNPSTIIGSVETTIDHPNIIKSGGTKINWLTAKVKILNTEKKLDDFDKGYLVEVSELTGRGTLFPSEVFRKVGLYDDIHIKQCADTELPIKASFKFGYKLLVCYDANVISYPANRSDINSKDYYTLSDATEFFFSIKSHFNLINRYWIARSIAPGKFWFARYLLLSIFRIIGRFVIRMKFSKVS
jgi:GT2 family glycosyltransferase